MNIDLYATVWTSLLFGAAFGAAACAPAPSRRASAALCVTFLLLAFVARPFIQWSAS